MDVLGYDFFHIFSHMVSGRTSLLSHPAGISFFYLVAKMVVIVTSKLGDFTLFRGRISTNLQGVNYIYNLHSGSLT